MKQVSRIKYLCLFIFCAINSVTSCPPILQKKGVNVECKLNGTTLDCGLKEIPEGTIASFSCGKYYFQEKSPQQGEMECNEVGEWEYLTDYEDFNCKIECGVTSRVSPVIVGGSQASKYDFPWHASIFLRNPANDLFDLVCGGSLIDLNDEGPLILTAAHCLPLGANMVDYRVVLGAKTLTFLENRAPNSQIFGVSFYEVHPFYNFTSLENDIAVMKLRGDPELSDEVKPICLERGSTQTKIGDIGIVAGFGLTEERIMSEKLLYAALPIRDHGECARQIPAKSDFVFPASTKFCAGYDQKNNTINGNNEREGSTPGICFGDSGGGFTLFDPIRKRSSIMGIAHAAFKDVQNACSGLGYFQSVRKYIGWIREVQKLVYPKKKTTSSSEIEGVEIMGSRCGSNPDWVEYKDEKCFRFVKQLATKEEASKICGVGFGVGNSLPILKSSDDHEFLIKFLQEKRVMNGVWLGAARGPLGFQWDNRDGMERFSKWAPNGNLGMGNCSIIQPRTGYWVEEDCELENLVICEKSQEFSNSELLQKIIKLKLNLNETERVLLEYKKGTQDQIEKQKADLENSTANFVSKLQKKTGNLASTNAKLDDTMTKLEETGEKLKKTEGKLDITTAKLYQMEIDMRKIIPVGFLYFQVGTQPSPVDLWPGYSWKDVSGDFAGLFFRVTGGGSASIGTIQAENAPRLGGVKFDTHGTDVIPSKSSKSISVPSSGWSQDVQTGFHQNINVSNKYFRETVSFQMTGGEVRPKNTAMRVWKRT